MSVGPQNSEKVPCRRTSPRAGTEGLACRRIDGRMGNEHPTRFLLLPYAHHAARLRRERPTVPLSGQHQRVSDYEGVPVHLGIDIAETEIVDFKGLEPL